MGTGGEGGRGFLQGGVCGRALRNKVVGGFGGGGGAYGNGGGGGGGGGYSGGSSGDNITGSCGGGGGSFAAGRDQQNECCYLENSRPWLGDHLRIVVDKSLTMCHTAYQ